MFTRIVVGVDCREGGRDALALATLLQSAGGGELVAVLRLRARAPAPRGRPGPGRGRAGTRGRDGPRGRRHRPLARSRLAHHRRAREAELVVIGSSRRAGAERILAGDDAAATLHCAPCAVAVAARGFADAPRALRRSGSASTARQSRALALALACRLAHQAGASISAIR